MNRFTKLSLALVLSIASAFTAFSQTQSKSESQAQEKIVVERSEVVLDAVVRDKKGRPVTNLSANDFEIYEDGARQQIDSFRLITRGPLKNATTDEQRPISQPVKTAKAATAIPLPSVENRPGAVALVFDRLAPDARARAHAAALAYIEQGLGPNDYVGVFRMDQSLIAVQTFTNDVQLIKQAIDQVATSGTSVYISAEKEIAKLWELHDELKRRGPSFELFFNEMRIRTAQDFERIERDQQGYFTPNSLLAVINGMGTLSGRKALVLFSEGIAIPPSAAARFRSIISNANRANVSIYTVDAAGLRAESVDAETTTAIKRIATIRLEQAMDADEPTGPLSHPMTRDLERNEDLVRKTPEGTLRQLASETGGTSISSTNDPGSHLRQVNEDLHSYYLLSYSPRNQDYDGRFRQINLRVTRAGMDVQARKGYYALRESYDSSVLEYEATALAMLGGKAVADAFQTHCAAFSFPEPTKPGLVPIVVEIPAGSISFLVDNAKTNYRSDFSVVVLIRNEAQKIVRKLSSHYLVSGSYDKLDAALNGNILFYKETQLEPGRYTVSSIVYDSLAKHSSTAGNAVTVPVEDQAKLQLSSIVLLKNAERLSSADKSASRLLRVGDVLLYPNLGEPLSKSDNSELRLLITVYAPRYASTPKLTLEVLWNGKILGQLPGDLPAPDQTGRIQYTGAIAIGALPPGEYELKATVTDGVSKASRSEQFTVQP